jgi:hypothetical protein
VTISVDYQQSAQSIIKGGGGGEGEEGGGGGLFCFGNCRTEEGRRELLHEWHFFNKFMSQMIL